MHFITSIIGAAVLLPVASAHGVIETIWGGGQIWDGNFPWSDFNSPGWAADNSDYGYVWDVSNINITCHNGATAGTQFIPLAAGSNVKVKWSGSWPHPGPVLTYMAKCPGTAPCTKTNSAALKWFKINHSGLIKNPNTSSTDPYWAAYKLRDNNNVAVIKLPNNLLPGHYVLRHEIIALHMAYNISTSYTSGGAQFYPQCINLRINGGGTLQPSAVAATALYKSTDPGVYTNIWWPSPTAYAIPGPTIAAGLTYKN